MLTIDDLRNHTFWKSELGFLPVPLFSDTNKEQPLVLFNGNRGNFCIDWGCFKLGNETRNYSWSSNISHYIAASEDKFEVQQWDQSRSSIERYSFASVAGNFEKFHDYLIKKSITHDLSVVAHVLRTFRRIRATLGTKVTGEESLRAFLYLLASIAGNVDRGKMDVRRWGLSENAADVADRIRPNDWSMLCEEILIGRLFQGLKPNIELMLRHASGQLFQDAHYEAIFIGSSQLLLDGFVPAERVNENETLPATI
jgi:adenine-specific DNA-methyltransferase